MDLYDRASWGAAVLRPYMGEVDLEKSVRGEGEGEGKKKQSVVESYGWASWGAAVLRPYTEGGEDPRGDVRTDLATAIRIGASR